MRRARFLLWLDVTLLLLFAFLEEPVTTGLWGHEWISIGFAGLLFLHLLVNWRWIAAALGRYRLAVRHWRARHRTTSHRSWLERLDLEGAGRVLGRFARLTAATVAVCAVSFALVAGVARARSDEDPPDRWRTPDFEEIPGEVSVQLLIVAISALVGRKV